MSWRACGSNMRRGGGRSRSSDDLVCRPLGCVRGSVLPLPCFPRRRQAGKGSAPRAEG
ncbi:hypothetical protein BDA96_08G036100 [Sorghum bicolor]|uniref:Uncharacterized protein n=1 Tax=Sorghum bicolor TaxID=4558 RepID=A0A921QDF0_SORBI|nr:hypothetical protein BDA96_08G036100 [Sorghum bicolor]